MSVEKSKGPKASKRFQKLRITFHYTMMVTLLSILIAWTLLIIWENQEALIGGLNRHQAIEFITDWVGPPIVILVVWLILSNSNQSKLENLGSELSDLKKDSDVLESKLRTIAKSINQNYEKVDEIINNLERGQEQSTHYYSKINADLLGSVELFEGQLETVAVHLDKHVTQQQAEFKEHEDRTLDRLTKRLNKLDEIIAKRAADAINVFSTLSATIDSTALRSARDLRRQLEMTDKAVSSLEARITQALASSYDEFDDNLAYRLVEITEKLNSQSIAIAGSFSMEISEKSWASYLKNDQYIFNRRTLKLLGKRDLRKIAELYKNDDSFKELTSRYLDDFEGMLRKILSTSDGHSIGITLLSSDIGRLYVILDKAIRRNH